MDSEELEKAEKAAAQFESSAQRFGRGRGPEMGIAFGLVALSKRLEITNRLLNELAEKERDD